MQSQENDKIQVLNDEKNDETETEVENQIREVKFDFLDVKRKFNRRNLAKITKKNE